MLRLTAVATAAIACQSSLAFATDIVNSFTMGSDLTIGTAYSAGMPTATSDVVFSNVDPGAAAAGATFSANTSETFGTLNDVNTLSPITVANTTTSGTTNTTLTLGAVGVAPGNTFAPAQSVNGGAGTSGTSDAAGAAGDLIYVGTRSTLAIQGVNAGSGTGKGTLSLGIPVGGNFDSNGVLTISSLLVPASATSSPLTFDGSGVINLTGSTNGSNTPSGYLQSGAVSVNVSGAYNFGGSSSGTSNNGITSGTLNVTAGNFTPFSTGNSAFYCGKQ